MTSEQQRIKLAEWDGWTRIWDPAFRQWVQRSPDNSDVVCDPDPGAGWETHRLPDYLSDLNAVHELLSKLTEDQLWKCIEHLVGWKPATPHGFPILSRSESIKLATATAGEWCEALLKTIGLWEETK